MGVECLIVQTNTKKEGEEGGGEKEGGREEKRWEKAGGRKA